MHHALEQGKRGTFLIDATSGQSAEKSSITSFLAQPSPATPGSSLEGQLQEVFLAKQLELSEIAVKRYHDDHATALSMPAEAPFSFDTARHQHDESKLSKAFESWARRARDTDGKSRDVRKRISECQVTINRFIELLSDLFVQNIRRKTVEEFQGLLRQLPSKGEGIRSLNAHKQIAKSRCTKSPPAQHCDHQKSTDGTVVRTELCRPHGISG